MMKNTFKQTEIKFLRCYMLDNDKSININYYHDQRKDNIDEDNKCN